MRYKTYKEIKDKVRKDLGLEQEEFVSAEELLGYCNNAIDEAEAEIHGIYADYFLTSTFMDIIAGQSEYTLPSDIYANKLRSVLYINGDDIYSIRKYKNSNRDKFLNLELDRTNTDDTFRYILMNRSYTGVTLDLIPTPIVSLTGKIKLYYLRNANRMVDDTSVCDIPEFVDFVSQYMKVRCYEKEHNENTEMAISVLQAKRGLMVSTLTNMVPDGDDVIEGDMTFYEEMGGNFMGGNYAGGN